MLKSKKNKSVLSFKEILTLKSEPGEILKVEHFLENLNRKLHLNDIRFNKLLVAATEAVNNGIIHGNKRDKRKKVVLICQLKNSKLIVSVKDEGQGLNPDILPDPLSQENLLRENGRGVFLMRSLMDDIKFKRLKKSSSVIMTMNI
jgi:serine/threonine-protein kinase RsbW